MANDNLRILSVTVYIPLVGGCVALISTYSLHYCFKSIKIHHHFCTYLVRLPCSVDIVLFILTSSTNFVVKHIVKPLTNWHLGVDISGRLNSSSHSFLT